MYLNMDDTNTFLLTCQSGGHWQSLADKFCYDCALSGCKTTCEYPSKNFKGYYTVYGTDGYELKNLSSEAPLKSKIAVRCKEGYTKLKGSKNSTCILYRFNSGWDPPLETCHKICEPVPPTRHVILESCKHFGNEVECKGILLASTSAFATCQKGYVKRAFGKERSNYAYCDEEGGWLNLPICVRASSQNKNADGDCYQQFYDIDWGDYTIFDADGNKLESLASYKPHRNITSTYIVPANSTALIRCKKGFFNLEGTNTLKSTCVAGSWQPPLHICYDCIQYKCIFTCDLPPFRYDIRYKVYDENDKKLVKITYDVPVKSKIEVECSENYVRADGTNIPSVSTCLGHSSGNGWQPEIKKCFKICNSVLPGKHIALTSCVRDGVETNCSKTVIAGTSAIAVCQKGYYSQEFRSSDYSYCDKFGRWLNLPNCITECGRVMWALESQNNDAYFKRALISSLGKIAIFGRYAWHVAIYRLDKNPLLICGGTIISSRMVISAAHCFYDDTNDRRLNRENYEIVVSKETRDYKKIDNARTKKYKLKEIVYPGISGNFGSDIAILVPQDDIEFYETFVSPACLAWTEQPHYDLGHDYKGEVYGWGLNEYDTLSETLTFVEIPYISYNDCIRRVTVKHVTPDKFCAGNETGPGVRKGDSGGGYLELRLDHYYLRGVVSNWDGRDSDSSISLFTDVSYYMKWIRNVKEKLDSGLPTSTEMDDKNNDVDGGTEKIIRASRNTKDLRERNNGAAICQKKNKDNVVWSCQKIGTCKFAQHLLSSKQETICGREGKTQKICCPFQVDPVQTAQEKCKEYAELRWVNETRSGQIIGTPDVTVKKLDCGPETETLIVGGIAALKKEFPHMALIGIRENEEEIVWTCGGSLISNQYVLSAAHCNDPNNPALAPKWVLLGKLAKPEYGSQIDSDKLFRIAQRINHPQYQSPKQDYDITLFRLERPVKLDSSIRPLCLALPLQSKAPSSKLFITGWGQTAVGEQESDVLLKAVIHRLEDNKCEETYRNEKKFRKGFDAKVMICAGHLYDTKDTCQGDSGGPLQSVIAHGQYRCMWLQEGITSLGSTFCGDKTPAVYTKVSSFLSWIQPIVWPAQDLKLS